MSMLIELDHVFICCEVGAPEAQALLDIGLLEGSSNIHPGQGTANRRFFFEGGFLELLWISDADEAQSPLTTRTKLWQRWMTRQQGYCPFGVAFRPMGETVSAPPFTTWTYCPTYLPVTKQILFADQTTLLEPELFYLAWLSPQQSSVAQPKNHPIGSLRLLSASIGIPNNTPLSQASINVQAAGLLSFHQSSKYELLLSFANTEPFVFDLSPSLQLKLEAHAEDV
jgi:hypothetical protein